MPWPLGPIDRFWFAPVNPLGLHIVRFLTGLVLLAWLLGYAGTYHDFLGRNGWFNDSAYQSLNGLRSQPNVFIPMPYWGRQLVAASDTGLTIQYWMSVAVLGLFTAGVATRITAPLTWLIVVAFTSNPVMDYGGDAVLLMLTLYLAAAYLLLDLRGGNPVTLAIGSRDAMPHRWLGLAGGNGNTSVWANVILRLIQIHTAIIIVSAGLYKLQDAEWWAGDALWYPMHPPFETDVKPILDLQGQADGYLILLSLATYLTLFWQINFPFLAWIKSTRWIAITGAVLGCLGCWFVYRVPAYGPALLAGTLAFVPACRWEQLLARRSSGRPEMTREFPRSAPTPASRTG